MASRAEVTTRYAQAHVKASKGYKVRILDQVVEEVMDWSRDNARSQLVDAAARGRLAAVGRAAEAPQTEPLKSSFDAVKVPQTFWGRLRWAVRKVPRGLDPSAAWA